jgi:hypothetical protein
MIHKLIYAEDMLLLSEANKGEPVSAFHGSTNGINCSSTPLRSCSMEGSMDAEGDAEGHVMGSLAEEGHETGSLAVEAPGNELLGIRSDPRSPIDDVNSEAHMMGKDPSDDVVHRVADPHHDDVLRHEYMLKMQAMAQAAREAAEAERLEAYVRDVEDMYPQSSVYTVAPYAGVKEVNRIETRREAIFDAVREGFANAFDQLVDDPALVGQGLVIAKEVWPDEIMSRPPSFLGGVGGSDGSVPDHHAIDQMGKHDHAAEEQSLQSQILSEMEQVSDDREAAAAPNAAAAAAPNAAADTAGDADGVSFREGRSRPSGSKRRALMGAFKGILNAVGRKDEHT